MSYRNLSPSFVSPEKRFSPLQTTRALSTTAVTKFTGVQRELFTSAGKDEDYNREILVS